VLRFANDPGLPGGQRGVLDQRTLDRVVPDFRTREGAPAYRVPDTAPELTTPHKLPPAIEELRRLEWGARSMILY
jgi:hypothetical protein